MKHAGTRTEINDRTPDVVASPASDQLAASAYVVSDRPVVLALRELTAGHGELAAIGDVSLCARGRGGRALRAERRGKVDDAASRRRRYTADERPSGMVWQAATRLPLHRLFEKVAPTFQRTDRDG